MARITTTVGELVGRRGGPLERGMPWLEQKLGTDTYRLLRALVRNPLSIVGMVILAFFVLIAVFAPVIAPPFYPDDPFQIPRDGFNPIPKIPMTEWVRQAPPPAFWLKPLTGSDQWIHFFGVASGGWDIFYGVVWGTRTAFLVGIVITGATVFLGVLIGLLSAYYGGIVDMVLMRITDIFFTVPFLVAALVLASVLTPVLGKSIIPPMIALMVFGWMGYARLIRGDTLSVKERDYVMAARVSGAKDRRIIFRHILPNAIFPTMVVASMDLGTYVITFSALSFLGIGAEVGYADWGQLLAFGRDWIPVLDQHWYMVVYPGVALVLFVLAWNLVGDAVRDILDPRLRGTR